MEWLVRRKIKICLEVPTKRSLYEYYFEDDKWMAYEEFR